MVTGWGRSDLNRCSSIILLSLATMIAVPSHGADIVETNIKKLKPLNSCVGCDLTGADLRDLDLVGINLVFDLL